MSKKPLLQAVEPWLDLLVVKILTCQHPGQPEVSHIRVGSRTFEVAVTYLIDEEAEAHGKEHQIRN